MWQKFIVSVFMWGCACWVWADSLPDTGISGVYEVMVGTDNASTVIEHFSEFGFTIVSKKSFSAKNAKALYGVDSPLISYRLQNGKIDTHGLLRVLEWNKPLGEGVGYAPPETVGQRMAVMRTEDIYRIDDVFRDLRESGGQPWLATGPVYDDLYAMSKGKPSIKNRRVGVREEGIYGEMFNHIFFQRYGYMIEGYGTIGEHSPLRSSEFTHHDFVVSGDLATVTEYYEKVLGLKPENDPVLDGDWQSGPGHVFQMEPGESHWYRGFVSPNNICGKLKFFSARDAGFVRDRSKHQRIGEKGITLHSFYTKKLDVVYRRAVDYGIVVTKIMSNEFGERAFVFTGPDGAHWQILEPGKILNKPVTQFELKKVTN